MKQCQRQYPIERLVVDSGNHDLTGPDTDLSEFAGNPLYLQQQLSEGQVMVDFPDGNGVRLEIRPED